MVLKDKPEVNQSMQPCLLKNSPSFYNTPTPKGWREPKKVIVLDGCSSLYNNRVQYFTRNLNMNPTQIQLITILGIKENIPNLKITWTLIFSFL